MVAYDGTRYHGWQRQNDDLTIQAVIEDCLGAMTKAPVKLLASGRTDAGVHALSQVCNFNTSAGISVDAFRRGLNSLLPSDIFVKSAVEVPLAFHARYLARSKTYEYRILNRQHPHIFHRHLLWHVRFPLKTERMSRCLSVLRGTHDFSAFKSAGSANRDPVRTILASSLRKGEDEILRITLEADGFLRHMVRNIVGTLVEVGAGRTGTDRFEEVLASRDRRLAGIKAPPQGLFLVSVKY